MSNDFFKMRGIVKQYQMGNEVQTILKGIDLDIEEGEFLSIRFRQIDADEYHRLSGYADVGRIHSAWTHDSRFG